MKIGLFRRGRHEMRINWVSEIKVAFLTSIMFLLVTTVFFWVVRQFSPGDYTGEKLNVYLCKRISKEIGTQYSVESIEIKRKEPFQLSLESKDGIVLYGNYSLDSTVNDVGRFVFIFERREANIWNDITGTQASYDITFAGVHHDEGVTEQTLLCDYLAVKDFNGDGKEEVLLNFTSSFGDRKSRSYMILQKKTHWSMAVPNLENLQKEINEVYGPGNTVMLDTFEFTDLSASGNKSATLYGLPYHGDMSIESNPLWGGVDLLYCVAVNDGTPGYMLTHHSAYIMERYTDSGLFRDTNWNFGTPYFVDEDGFERDEVIPTLWGIQVGGSIFYGPDVGQLS